MNNISSTVLPLCVARKTGMMEELRTLVRKTFGAF
jgi:hypothetical protein